MFASPSWLLPAREEGGGGVCVPSERRKRAVATQAQGGNPRPAGVVLPGIIFYHLVLPLPTCRSSLGAGSLIDDDVTNNGYAIWKIHLIFNSLNSSKSLSPDR